MPDWILQLLETRPNFLTKKFQVLTVLVGTGFYFLMKWVVGQKLTDNPLLEISMYVMIFIVGMIIISLFLNKVQKEDSKEKEEISIAEARKRVTDLILEWTTNPPADNVTGRIMISSEVYVIIKNFKKKRSFYLEVNGVIEKTPLLEIKKDQVS